VLWRLTGKRGPKRLEDLTNARDVVFPARFSDPITTSHHRRRFAHENLRWWPTKCSAIVTSPR
jgi:hypothetical protein